MQRCFDAIKNINRKEIGLGNVSSIKPINKKNLKNLVNRTKEIIIFEDHNIHGGMGSAILEKLAEIENKKKLPFMVLMTLLLKVIVQKICISIMDLILNLSNRYYLNI